jgi:hypothetical protein
VDEQIGERSANIDSKRDACHSRHAVTALHGQRVGTKLEASDATVLAYAV